jgi:chorismate lyase/3-hydroxybenzoate synthase
VNAGVTMALPAAPPRLVYRHDPASLPGDTLGAVVFGRHARAECAALRDPRLVAVPLEAVEGTARVESWMTEGPVVAGEREGVRFVASPDHLFGVLELDEATYGGPRATGREAYQRLVHFHEHGEHRHVWRVWNFLDAVNEGEGDDERYRQFCLGRAEGIGTGLQGYPAASALGRRDGSRILQVLWIAGRTPPERVENPRQVSAFRYPRQYGPASPSFSRAARLGDRLLISGTASIVGHETRHDGDVRAQTRESVVNLGAVAAAAGFPADSLAGLKAYVRHGGDVAEVVAELRSRGYGPEDCCLLLADVCRSDLLVEFEAVARR